jgi:NitT/TauT family transport system substrate-binding protein
MLNKNKAKCGFNRTAFRFTARMFYCRVRREPEIRASLRQTRMRTSGSKRRYKHRLASVLIDSEVRNQRAGNAFELRNRDTGEQGQRMPPAIAFRIGLGFVVAAAVSAQAAAQPLDKVSFGTNWVAEGEHGGFYQALADGTYRQHGLDVTIVPGGPNVNNRILLPVGKIDFFLSANTLQAFDAVEQNVPTIEVAAMFQKDPQVLIAHPDQGVEKFTDLKKLTLFISREGVATYYQWLKADFGFTDAQVRPYTFNAQPFLANDKSAMQGYVTSEPFAIAKTAKFSPQVFLLADQGFSAYSTLIETRRELVDKKPDLVQRFVDASIIGWYNYIYGDNRAANALIKKQNPEMTDELLAYCVSAMKKYGIVDSGDALTLGIGAMTDARMKDFFDKMVRADVTKPDLDYRRGYTLQFVDKKVGIDLRPKQ